MENSIKDDRKQELPLKEEEHPIRHIDESLYKPATDPATNNNEPFEEGHLETEKKAPHITS